MKINFHDILPEEISGEAAYYLAQALMDLSLAIESHYYGRIQKYVMDSTPSRLPDCLKNKPDDENSF